MRDRTGLADSGAAGLAPMQWFVDPMSFQDLLHVRNIEPDICEGRWKFVWIDVKQDRVLDL